MSTRVLRLTRPIDVPRFGLEDVDVCLPMKDAGIPGETIRQLYDKFSEGTLKCKLVTQQQKELACTNLESELNKEQAGHEHSISAEVASSQVIPAHRALPVKDVLESRQSWERAPIPTVVPESRLQQVKDFVESGQLFKALEFVDALQSDYPSSALVLALKAHVYERNRRPEALSICHDAKERFSSDISVLPNVLTTLKTVCVRLRRLDLATSYYEYACKLVPENLDMMRELFDCYVRDFSFIKQLKVSLEMYKLSREYRFVLWAVFSIQLQVLYHYLEKLKPPINTLDEPKTLLVYISVTEQQAKYDIAHEILSKLGVTLAAVEFSSINTVVLS